MNKTISSLNSSMSSIKKLCILFSVFTFVDLETASADHETRISAAETDITGE